MTNHTHHPFSRLWFGVLLILWLSACNVYAERSFYKYWTPITLNGNYGETFYWFEPQFRFIMPEQYRVGSPPVLITSNPSIFQQFLGSIALGKEIRPGWIAWFGQTMTTEAQDAVRASQVEYRSLEQLTIDYDATAHFGFKLNSRLRTEQRKSLDFPQWAFRIRERIILHFPLTHNMGFEVSDEALYNLNSVPWIDTTAWDQNRAYVAIVQTVSDRYQFAVGYLNQYLFRDDPQNNHVMLVNLRFFLFEKR